MPAGTYERYGLNGNPFRDLSSETLEDIELYHVNLGVDEELRSVKEEVLEKENKAVIALLGPLGSGKTERLLLAAAEGRAAKAFVIYFDLTEKTTWILRGLTEEFKKAAGGSGFSKMFSPPKWLAPLTALAATKDEKYDPLQAGKAIAGALNANVPAFLLLNDLHNLTNLAEANASRRPSRTCRTPSSRGSSSCSAPTRVTWSGSRSTVRASSRASTGPSPSRC